MREIDSFDSKQLKSLIEEIGNLHSSFGDRESLLLQIVKSAMALLLCERGSLFLADSVAGATVCACSVDSFGERVSDGGGLSEGAVADWVVRNEERLVFHSAASNREFFSSARVDESVLYSNVLAVPFFCGGTCAGALVLCGRNDEKPFKKGEWRLLDFFLGTAGQVYANASAYFSEKALCSAALGAAAEKNGVRAVPPGSDSLADLLDVIDEIAKTNTIVLVSGEPGVGKEVFARSIHEKSPRRKKPFFAVDCVLADRAALESAFLRADSGTLFLDRVENLSRQAQERLFDFIKERTVRKRDSAELVVSGARIIASAGRDLLRLVEEGRFIADLYYRLCVFPLTIPPLRERKGDIRAFAEYFLRESGVALHKTFSGFSREAMDMLLGRYWPGNVRELKNAVERACMKSGSEYVQVDDFAWDFESDGFSVGDVETAAEEIFRGEKDKSLKNAMTRFKSFYVKKVLAAHGWNQTAAGKVLGVQRTYVSRLLKDLDLR